LKLTNNQAILAQQALKQIVMLELPVKTSLEIVRLSQLVDQQISEAMVVRNLLVNKYRLKVKAGAEAQPVFTFKDDISEEEKIKALERFTKDIDELMIAKGIEIDVVINIPNEVNIKPELLKPIRECIRVQ